MNKPFINGDNNINIEDNKNNVQINHYATEKIIKVIDDHQCDPNIHISPAQQLKIFEIVADVTEMMRDCDKENYSAKMYKSLYDKYLIPKYTLLPKYLFDDAVLYLKRQKAIFRKNLKILNAERFKEYIIPTILARWNAYRKNESLFEFTSLKLRKNVTDLKKLSVNDLDTLHNGIFALKK